MLPLTSQKKPCIFYRTNSCTKGECCPFEHTRQPSRRVCKHYSTGSCMFGERCRDLHSIPGKKANVGFTKIPCKFWNAGQCSAGDRCYFLHEPLSVESETKTRQKQQSGSINPQQLNTYHHEDTKSSHAPCVPYVQRSVAPRVEKTGASQPDVLDSRLQGQDESRQTPSSGATTERNFPGLGRVQATFDAGGAIHEILTAFESRRVTLSNIPHEATQSDVIDMAEKIGALKSTILIPPAFGIPGRAELEYVDVDSAKRAARTLDGKNLYSRRITALLNLRSTDMDTADLRSSTLKMSWFAPSQIAYAQYNTIRGARSKASSLDGKFFADRKVSATFQQPGILQSTSFTVILKGLPGFVNIHDLKQFCGTNSVKLGQSNYAAKEGARRIRELLEGFGPVESFDHSHPKLQDVKIKALVRFAKPEHADAAAKKLQGESHDFLGGAKTWITLLHSIKYSVPMAQYNVLKDELKKLQDKDDHRAQMRIYEPEKKGLEQPVCVRIYSDDPKALGQLKVDVERTLLGEEVRDEGVAVWDDFFLGEGSLPFLEELQKESGSFVRRDTRRKKLHVSGNPAQRNLAEELVLKKMQELRKQRHRIELTRPQMGRLLQGALANLTASLGADKLTLDIQSRTLVVQGDEEEIQAARLALITLEGPAEATWHDGDCPVCLCEVTHRVQLACGHHYCFACLRQYLASAETFPVKCLAESGHCESHIPLTTISRILGPADETKFFDTAFLTYINEHPTEFRYCPTPDCQLIYRPAEAGIVIRCFSCLARICAHCHVENHEGLTCEEHRYNQSGDESLNKRWKEANNVRGCPECTAPIEKIDGCNHITCPRCRTHFCWVCLGKFAPGEIYIHMNRAHGGIGIDF
ncbi:hypothetical protein K439DRAFT_131801 [Ramaria rubella]|nr:hypothetical protein K439DRAFT_131801 [Ramaria rubella]